MIILIFALAIALALVLRKKGIKEETNAESIWVNPGEIWLYASGFIFLCAVVVFVAAFVIFGNLIDAGYIEDRIAVVQGKNEEVEAGIQAMVKSYLEHEGKTYEGMTPEEAVAYATAYPTLASNELVKEQISTYKENRKKILEYEQQKIDRRVLRWWLYFGGAE